MNRDAFTSRLQRLQIGKQALEFPLDHGSALADTSDITGAAVTPLKTA